MAETTTEAAAEAPLLSVDEAMIEVMRAIGPVGKRGRNTTQNYAFRTQEDIVAAVRGPMANAGLRMLPTVVSHEHFTRGGQNVAILVVDFTFRGPAGDTMPPIRVIGEGADSADKASNKAMTAAKKYAFIQAFEIGDGADDGDYDHPVDTRSEGSPLRPYLDRIRKPSVWQSPEALDQLLTHADNAGVADHPMPDDPTQTLRQFIKAQGEQLLRERRKRAVRRDKERPKVRAQMTAEHPTPSAGDRGSARVDTAREGNQPATPEPGADPSGTVQESAAELEGDVAPDATAPASPPVPARPAEARRRLATAADRARANMVAELEFQAQMLGKSRLDFAGSLLPPDATSLEQATRVRAMQDHIRTHRPQVVAAMLAQGMNQAAGTYAEFGDRVPASKITDFIRGVVQPQP
ncbi:ERF family protein [Streptomyces sp. NPDC097619]|uniref:ERF family protein n=1 Tax=Streptomyces sp. NPDC097619 TaxID=3157228 RepID=UPI00333361BA